MSDKPYVWRHSCTLHGEGVNPDGSVRPCDPPCEFVWQVDPPTEARMSGYVARDLDTAMVYARILTLHLDRGVDGVGIEHQPGAESRTTCYCGWASWWSTDRWVTANAIVEHFRFTHADSWATTG